MSVESTITKVIYVGNGLATKWPVPFKYNKPEHLHLLVSDASGAHELVTSNFQVQVTEAGDTSILYPVSGLPLAAGKRLTIYRATPQTQIVDLIYGGAFAPEVLEEDGLDREVMMIQELQEGLDRAVKVDIDSDETPEDLRENIFTARDEAVDSASSARASATAAAESARAAAGSAAIATEGREAACVCAGEAKDARDVAIAQTEAANTLMEAELAKVNAIVAANKTDQQAAVAAARAWAEKAPDVPVDYDEEGNAHYSAQHWAERAQKLANNPDGETITVDADGVLKAIGGNLLVNSELLITESGEWEAPVTGWYEVVCINGGVGGTSRNAGVGGGGTGNIKIGYARLNKGETYTVTVGAGGIPSIGATAGLASSGGVTSFSGLTEYKTIYGLRGIMIDVHTPANSTWRVAGAGFGGGGGQEPDNAKWYGAGGGAVVSHANNTYTYTATAGFQGAVILRFHDPAKAAGPEATPALFTARRMAVRAADAPATVNLYDPATGQGSVWREEDAEAKLAEGLISEEAWLEIRAARVAEEYAAWLANPETEAERFALLRAARDAKLASTDYLVAPDYPLSEEQKALVTACRQALRDLPAQEGAPWDGGGELTPWPDAPEVSKVTAQE